MDARRWESEQPPDWAEALVTLIDALREYIRTSREMANGLYNDGEITKEQFDTDEAETKKLDGVLAMLEKHCPDPSLNGLLGEARW